MKFIPDSHLDLILDKISLSDEKSICSALPLSWYNATWPSVLWTQETTYISGDLVRPPTQNNCIYECVLDGTSGFTEPSWGLIQDTQFVDGSTEWKTHENFSLINTPMSPSDYTKSDGGIDGRKLTIAQKLGSLVHTSGTVSHLVYLESSTKTIHFIRSIETLEPADNDVESGRTSLFPEDTITIRDPV